MWQGQHKAWGTNIQFASILCLFLDAIASQARKEYWIPRLERRERRRHMESFEDRSELQQSLWLWGSPSCVLEGRRSVEVCGVSLGGGLELNAAYVEVGRARFLSGEAKWVPLVCCGSQRARAVVWGHRVCVLCYAGSSAGSGQVVHACMSRFLGCTRGTTVPIRQGQCKNRA